MTSVLTCLPPNKENNASAKNMSVFLFYFNLNELTESKHPKTPAARTGRAALDNKLSLLSKIERI